MKKFITTLIIVAMFCMAGCDRVPEPPPVTERKNVTRTVLTPSPAPAFDLVNVELKNVDSSCFSRIGYDSEFEVLVAEFKETGTIYAYYDFSQSDYNKFLDANSLGNYFNEYIKDYYDYERLN